MQNTCVVVDYGSGNIHSVAKALTTVAPETKVVVSGKSEDILAADKVVLPGVGAIQECMRKLNEHHLIPVIREIAENKPLLGICIGMHMMMERSSENGGVDGLAFFRGQVKKFPSASPMRKVPHMGWNQMTIHRPHPIWHNIAPDDYFYFVHSYYVMTDEINTIIGEATYGVDYVAAIARDNVVAVQFHPEKSHRAGLTLLGNFCRWAPC